MLSLKLWRKVRQKFCKSKIPVGGGTADVGVSVSTPRRVVIVRVHNGVSVGRARATVLNSSIMVFLSFLSSSYGLTISPSIYGYNITWSPM